MAASSPEPAAYGPKPGILAPLPSAERGVATVLHTSPCGKFIAYGSGSNVIVRSLEDPSLAFAYCDHTDRVKVAKFAPTGKYIASGDAAGRVRVWAFTQAEHSLKYELPSIGGEVEDLAWDSESKRILVVGGGSAKAKFFSWDTGSQLGEVIPHSKKNITCDFKPSRPFKAVFGGEDFNLSFYGGPPFRYEKGLKEHANFVNCVRYAPDGSRFISVASDKVGIVYDGTTAGVIGRLDATQGHTGSIYGVSWSADGTRVVTCGGDKAVKIWDLSVEGDKFPCVATFTLGKAIEDMQEGVAWASTDLIVSLSLDGTLNYLKPSAAAEADAAPAARIVGHQAAMHFIDVDPSTGEIVTGDVAGRVCVWRPTDEAHTVYTATVLKGDVPTKKVAGVTGRGGEVAVVSWDDKLRIGEAASNALKAAVAMPGQPKGIAVAASNPKIKVVVTGSAIVVVDGAAAPVSTPAVFGPTCVDISADGSVVAVGGKDRKIHVYKLAAGVLTADGETKEFGGELSVVAVHPDGSAVAGGDAVRDVRLYSTGADKAAIRVGRWVYHTTRVTGLKWSPNGRHLVSVSTDRRLCVWDPNSDAPKLSIDLANPAPFAAVAWADDNTVWTVGIDGVALRRSLAL